MSTETINTEPPQEHRGVFGRVAAVAGIAWIVLTVISIFLVGSIPTAADDAGVVRDYFSENVGSHQAGLAAIVLSLVPLLIFAAGLAGMLRRAGGADGWSTATGALYVFATAVGSIGLVVEAAMLLSRDAGLDDGTLLALWDINMASTGVMVLGFGGAVASASISSLTNRTRPNWYGGLGLVVGIAGLFGLASLISDSDTAAAASFVVLPLLVIWTIITSVFMYREA